MIELVELDWEHDDSINEIKKIYCKSIKTVLGKIAKKELELFDDKENDDKEKKLKPFLTSE